MALSEFAKTLNAKHELQANSLESYDSEEFGRTIFWTAPTAAIVDKYRDEMYFGKRLMGMQFCFFLRACDKKGKRLFRSQDDLKAIKELDSKGQMEMLKIVAKMEGGAGDELFGLDGETDPEKKAGNG